ncbi:MAG: hypothetical protein KatS3mg015_3128 [Fimbriimonadales bacterium]|nr:MAG: hypothetical protein KatS3mg015_3128 [Fimbriimonadales bacterium]
MKYPKIPPTSSEKENENEAASRPEGNDAPVRLEHTDEEPSVTFEPPDPAHPVGRLTIRKSRSQPA